MKSLKLWKAVCYDKYQSDLGSVQCVAVDRERDRAYFLCQDKLFSLDLTEDEILSTTHLSRYGQSKAVSMEFFPDEEALCIAFENGVIVRCHPAQEVVEVVRDLNEGMKTQNKSQHLHILALQWSPDQEVAVMVTNDMKVRMIDRTFDPIYEVDVETEGATKPLNLGWGRKATQFHGSAGKEAAKEKPSAETENKTGHDSDWKFTISWRGDGHFFAISCPPLRDRLRRVVRTWTRDCEPHSIPYLDRYRVDNLGSSLSWQPSGSLIASTQSQSLEKNLVLFFEKNGLTHGEFTLDPSLTVRNLSWNTDSSVLCVWSENDDSSFLQLRTRRNYHWYLKQCIAKNHAGGTPVIGGFLWDPERSLCLHVWFTDGRYATYDFTWTTYSSHGELSSVAVVDELRLLVTPFKNAVVPPPMAGYSFKTKFVVQDVAFAPSSNRMVVLLDDNSLLMHTLAEYRDDRTVDIQSNQTRFLSVPPEFAFLPFQHLTMVTDNKLITVSQKSNRTSTISVFTLSEEYGEIAAEKTVLIEGNIRNVVATTNDIAVQKENGSVHRLDIVLSTLKPWIDSDGNNIAFPTPCNRMALCTFRGETVVLGLSDLYRFYVNSTEIAANCTSFAVHEKFVLLTTHSHTLRCLSRSTRVADLTQLADGKSHPFDEVVRRVERGSQLVTTVAANNSIVLQMPRGNLETIYPRALVLDSVRRHLDRSHYDLAFNLMKTHRINMNLIHDHYPEKFLDEIMIFAAQIPRAEDLNIFLTELSADDVTVTMYDAAYRDQTRPKIYPDKVETVCDKIRNALREVDEEKFFLSILTCHVRKRVPDLESALFEVQRLRTSQLNVSIDDAMKYLIMLVDVNQLFDIALGTYDFDLVLMVAEKSHKDPKEYLPLLNQLRDMETNYRQFTIDKMLKRYSRALDSIVKCEERFDECLSLVVEYELYLEALAKFQRDSERYRKIAQAHGHFLEEKKYYEEAGYAYWKSADWDAAIRVYTKALRWREVICVGEKADLTNTQKNDLYRNLAAKLKSENKFSDAAEIYERYLNDHEESVATLIEGAYWMAALTTIHKCKRFDMIETNLRPKMAESIEQLHEEIPDLRRVFEEYCERLGTVRSEKERRHYAELMATNDGQYNDAGADLYSDTSSASGESVTSKRTQSSFFSTASSRTNRSKRKAERKKHSLKHGSPNEDLALVDALLKLINRVEQLKTEIGPLLRILVLFDMTSEAQKIQDGMVAFLDLIKKKIPEIWLEEEEEIEHTVKSSAEALAISQRRKMLKEELNREPTLRSPPVLKPSQEWKLRTLKS